MKSLFFAGCLGLVTLAAVPVQAGEGVRLAPHRVVYDLSLATSRGERGVETARGRIAFEFTGNACEGYALKYRQVTVLESSENGTKTSDLRTANFESGDGKTFRFRNDSQMDGGSSKVVDGSAEKRPEGSLAVRLKAPKSDTFALGGAAVFPNAQMKDLIVAARAGTTTVSLKVFDGSEDGHKIYDTLAVIGHPVIGGGDDLEPAARQDGLKNMTRWPVTLSYFNEGRGEQTPVYTLSFDLYENGVSRALKLDYNDFALKGEMQRLDLLPETKCQQ
jgi:hypothetical protein